MKSFLIFHIFFSICYSQYRYGTTSANFLEIGTSSNAVGMGEAYVSIADDAISAYWNPAALAQLDGFELGVSSQNWVADIRHFSVSSALRMGSFGTIGLWFTDFDYGSIEVTNVLNQNGTGESYRANELATAITYGKSLVDWFSFGASIKSINSNIWHTTASAVALDLGVIVRTQFFSISNDRKNGMKIGMSISNYGSKMRYDGIDLINPIDILENENGNYETVIGQFRTEYWELPLIFRMGASIKPIVKYNQSLILSADILHPNNNSESINIGSQYSFVIADGNSFFLRTGLKGIGIEQANEETRFLGYEFPFASLTYGIGFEKKLVRNQRIGIDYSYQSVGILGDVSLISMRLKLF